MTLNDAGAVLSIILAWPNIQDYTDVRQLKADLCLQRGGSGLPHADVDRLWRRFKEWRKARRREART